jgi:ankyrin repeat protein
MGGCPSKASSYTADEHRVLPNKGKPPSHILIFIKSKENLMYLLREETREHNVLSWLKLAIPLAHASGPIQTWTKKLLATQWFTTNMSLTCSFDPIQTFVEQELFQIGVSLSQLNQEENYFQRVGAFMPLVHPDFENDSTLRQDHPLVGLVPSSAMRTNETFIGESSYIHTIRLVASVLDPRFQSTVKDIVAPFNGDYKRCAIKGDARMRNKALAHDGHRYLAKPRPALNTNVIRCGVTFEDPEAFQKGVTALVKHFQTSGNGTGGIGQIKNGFVASTKEASKAFHYRTYTIHFLVDFGITYGELTKRQDVVATFHKYLQQLPENPTQSKYQWTRDATAAVNHLNSPKMSTKNVKMICEVQVLLRPYLNAKKKMHLLQKIARAESADHLAQQFAHPVPVSNTHATLKSEELRCVANTKQEVAKGKEFALYNACVDGFLSAAQIALAVVGVDINQCNGGQTPLYVACDGGHVDIVQALVEKAEIRINQTTNTGATALWGAVAKGQIDVVLVMLDHEDIDINQATKNGVPPVGCACAMGFLDTVQVLLVRTEIQLNQTSNKGETPLHLACQKGRVDVVQLLLARKKIQINQANHKGETPLNMACQNGHVCVVRVLLENSVECFSGNDWNPLVMSPRETPLLVNHASKKGETPLYMACAKGHLRVVTLLLTRKEVDVNRATKTNQTPINAASLVGASEIVDLLLQQPNIDITKTNDFFESPVMSASEEGHSGIARQLSLFSLASESPEMRASELSEQSGKRDRALSFSLNSITGVEDGSIPPVAEEEEDL